MNLTSHLDFLKNQVIKLIKREVIISEYKQDGSLPSDLNQ